MPRSTPLAAALLALALAGCGGGGGHSTEGTKSVRVAGGGTVLPGGSLTFVAYVEGGGNATWTTNGGAIASDGTYTAPTVQGIYTVTATAGGKTGTAQVEVTTGISIALTSPTTVPLTVSKSTLKFTAAVTGATDKTVDWSVDGATGAITADGTFTAPATPGTYTVVGKSHADPAKTVAASVQVASNVNVRIKWQNKGDVVIALRPDKAPNSVANYVTLVNKGFYDGIVVHRYEAGFVIQWGDPTTKNLTASAYPNVNFETNDLLNVKYTLAYARIGDDANSASTQVFVNLVDNAFLDHKEDDLSTSANEFVQGYAVFGSALSGQATIDALRQGDTIVAATTELP